MPPKTAVPPPGDIKEETVLQAILLGDPYTLETPWAPLVLQDEDEDDHRQPWCLLPLLGVPLLGWTLESLASAGVHQVLLIVRQGAETIRSYLETTSFVSAASNTKLVVKVVSTTAFTPGDVLREVDSRALLATSSASGSESGAGGGGSSSSEGGAFLLVQCGYIGNLNLTAACTSFSARRKQDNNMPCMSSIVRPTTLRSPSTHRSIHALSPAGRLVRFQHSPRHPRARRIALPKDVFKAAQGSDIILRADLEPVGVEICSIEVPALFTENFDYQQIRPDFVNGILTSDLLGKTIFCEVVGQSELLGSNKALQWAGIVSDPRTYDIMSNHILARRAQPFIPDGGMPGGEPYVQRRRHIYYGLDVDLAVDCEIPSLSLLGSRSSLHSMAVVTHSTLGSHCVVGEGSSVTNSHLFRDVSIGRACQISHSIIAENVRVLDEVVVGSCIIGAGCVIGKGARLRRARVGLSAPSEDRRDEDGDGSPPEEFEYHLGVGGKGFVWPLFLASDATSSDGEDESKEDIRNQKLAQLGISIDCPSFMSSASSISLLSEASDSSYDSSSRSSTSRVDAIPGVSSLGEVGSTNDFFTECVHSLDRAFAEGHTVDNAGIELKTLRMASNVPQNRVRAVVVPYICSRATNASEVVRIISRWGGLIAGLVGDDEEAMVDCLVALQKHCAEDVHKAKLFPSFLQAFYNDDIVSEEGVVGWFRSPLAKSSGGEIGQRLRLIGAKFVQKLNEASSEDDDDDDDDEED